MKLFITHILILVSLLSFCLSCQKDTSPDEKNAEVQINKCYQKTYPFPDHPEAKDIVELNLQISKNTVKAEYNWLPAYKDKRKGSVEGVLQDSIINGTYIFMQEGIKDTAAIKITLKESMAIITGKPDELGLAATLPSVKCSS